MWRTYSCRRWRHEEDDIRELTSSTTSYKHPSTEGAVSGLMTSPDDVILRTEWAGSTWTSTTWPVPTGSCWPGTLWRHRRGLDHWSVASRSRVARCPAATLVWGEGRRRRGSEGRLGRETGWPAGASRPSDGGSTLRTDPGGTRRWTPAGDRTVGSSCPAGWPRVCSGWTRAGTWLEETGDRGTEEARCVWRLTRSHAHTHTYKRTPTQLDYVKSFHMKEILIIEHF